MAFWRALLRLKTGSTSWQGSVVWLSALDILTSWLWAAKVMINSCMHGFLKSIAETQDRINQLTGQRCVVECSWHFDILIVSCQSDDKLLHAWLSEEHCWDSRQDQPADRAALCGWVLLTSWHLDILMVSCQSDDKLLHAWLSEEHCWDSRQDQPADRAALCGWVLLTFWHLDCELPQLWQTLTCMAFWRALLRLKTGSTSWQGSVVWLSALDILTSWLWAAKVMINSYMHGFLKSIAETQDRINQLTGQRCVVECSYHFDILIVSCHSYDKLLHAFLSEEHCWDSRQDQPLTRQRCAVECSWHLTSWLWAAKVMINSYMHGFLKSIAETQDRINQLTGQRCVVECS